MHYKNVRRKFFRQKKNDTRWKSGSRPRDEDYQKW